MKILLVTCFFKPSWESGGPARIAYEISKKLIERGHEVTVYTTDGFKSRLEVNKNKPVDVDGIKTYYFRNLFSYLTRKMNLPIPYYLPIVARRALRDFDVVHIHEHRTLLAVVAYYYAKKYGIPYILSPYGSLPNATGFLKNYLKHAYDLVFGLDILKNAERVTAQNEHEIEECKKFGIKKRNVVFSPLGTNLSEFNNLPSKGLFREKYSLNEGEKIILFLGRIHEYKGIQLLVKAFSELIKVKHNFRLIIVGSDDGYLSALKNLIKSLELGDKVILPGPLYDKDRIAAYVDADVFVLTPSHYEETSLAVLEACATGTPVIISKQNDVPGLIHYKGGFVINYDQKELQEVLLKVLTNDKLRETLGKNARKLIEEKFDLNKVVDQLEKVYTDCLLIQKKSW